VRALLRPAPWHQGQPSPRLREAVELLDGSWRVAAGEYYADRQAKLALGKPTPKGVQRFLNRVLDERFEAAGWEVHDGRYLVDRTWVRVTFRHQMSLGADLLDALKVAHNEDVGELAILAASAEALVIISPGDHRVLVSYEKLLPAVQDLDGCMDIPLFIGRLSLQSTLPNDVARVIHGDRS
jgi:hypothetical protein